MKILVGEKLNGYGDVIKIPYETSKFHSHNGYLRNFLQIVDNIMLGKFY